MTTCICGLTYVPGVSEDDEHHAYVHDEYLKGPCIPVGLLPARINEIQGKRVYVIDDDLLTSSAKRFAYVAEVASREMKGYKYGFYGEITEADEKLFLAVHQCRAVAAIIACTDDRHWQLQWCQPSGARLVSNAANTQPRAKVARAWVGADYRRQGLARELVDVVAHHYGVGIIDLGWELPFTAAGETFVRALSGDQFWGSGDVFALEPLLRVCRGHDSANQTVPADATRF